MDEGTENYLIEDIQRAFRLGHADNMAQKSVIKGSSHSNQASIAILFRCYPNNRSILTQYKLVSTKFIPCCLLVCSFVFGVFVGGGYLNRGRIETGIIKQHAFRSLLWWFCFIFFLLLLLFGWGWFVSKFKKARKKYG